MEDRRNFFARLEKMPERERMMVELAYTLAKDAHRHQKRQERGDTGDPLRYFEHPRRVTLIMLDELGIDDWEAVCIALLHDVIEDTRYITRRHLEYWLSARVAEGVSLLTKLPREGYERRLADCGEWRALVAKGCDRLDNLRSLGSCSPEKRLRKARETVSSDYAAIFNRMVEVAPASHLAAVSALRRSIVEEARHFIRT